MADCPTSLDARNVTEELAFEPALARLETLIGELEDGTLGLAESLACYEEGVNLIKQCHAILRQAELKVELLTGVTAAGEPITTALADSAAEVGGAGRPRGKRAVAKEARPPRAEKPTPRSVDDRRELF